jgi:hypothetical protein
MLMTKQGILMMRTIRIISHSAAALSLAGVLTIGTVAQKVGSGTGTKTPTGGNNEGSVKVGRGVVVTQTVTGPNRQADLERIRTTSYSQNEGTIVLFAVPGAVVSLTSVGAKVAAQTFMLDKGDTLTLSKLKPGTYKIKGMHPDYKEREETVTIKSGDVKPFTNFLMPKYGEIVVGGAPMDVTLMVDNKIPDPKLVKRESSEGKITISRLLEGKHVVTLSKDGYDPWTKEINVVPGETTPESAEVKLATVTLTVNSKPGARVYLNKADRGKVDSGGKLIIADLLPGTYQMRVALDGFSEIDKPINLTLKDRHPNEPINLSPIPESGERAEDFTTGASKWIVPANWKLDKKGLVIKGDEAGLFKDPTEDRSFNVYFDFDLEFDVRFSNGKGVSWVTRAKDTKDYYLFELTPSPRARFNFYICRGGQCTLKDARPIVEKLDAPGDSYHIRFEARGTKFSAKLSRLLAPSTDGPQPIGTFEDRENTFGYGGIGFRGYNDSEALLQSLVVIPVKRSLTASSN